MRLEHVGVDSFKFCVVWSWVMDRTDIASNGPTGARRRDMTSSERRKVHLACAEDDAFIRRVCEAGAKSDC